MTVQGRQRVQALAAMVALAGACAGQGVLPPAPAPGWQFTVGMGILSQPRYPGSSDTLYTGLPLFSADYGRFFVGGASGAGLPAGAGAYLVQDGPWRLGLGVGANLRKPRREADDPHLQGLGDVDGTEFGSLFASYNKPWFSARTSVVTDIGGQHQGTRLALDLEGRFSPVHDLMLTAGPGLTWADSQYTRTFFGIDRGQSARSGLPVHAAGSGINLARFALGADYRLSPAWGVGLHLSAASLRGDAEASPITERKAQNTYALFGSYRF
jgi:outer membrane protein